MKAIRLLSVILFFFVFVPLVYPAGPSISARLVDEEGQAISFASVGLVRWNDQYHYYEWVASCDPYNDCPDVNGGVVFIQTYDGKDLIAGDYGFLPYIFSAEFKFAPVYFTLGEISKNLGDVIIPHVDFTLDIEGLNSVPEAGGLLEWRIVVSPYHQAHGIETMVIQTTIWSQGLESYSAELVLFDFFREPLYGALARSQSLVIPGTLAKGSWICGEVRLLRLNKPFVQQQGTFFCSQKGGYNPPFSSNGSASPAPSSFPIPSNR